MKKYKGILPGILACVVIAIISKVLGKFVPALGAATFAILLGVLFGNTILDKKVFSKGIKFSEKVLLAWAIGLLGVILNLHEILSIGYKGVIFIVIQMSLTLVSVYFIGRKLGFGKKFSLLMCAGNAICGSSAIAATSDAIEADSKDKGISVAIVNLTGTILMFVLPGITYLLYNNSLMKSSAMIGGILQSVGQVVASGKMVSPQISEMATIFKIIRIMLLVVVVLAIAKFNSGHDKKEFKHEEENIKKSKVSVPWFIYLFFGLTILYTLGLIPQAVGNGIHQVGDILEIVALAAIGCSVKFKDLIEQGPKALIYGGTVGVLQIVFAIILIMFLL
ncbi:YeiH family protein [uncultured Clostridium sp.]|uniref:YeiH family protein n=1 Tax=uncultured Clostridium sp. TaxID=59620 RepID=UPI0026081882|nr:putative sulfate exporter family transporter [uncultured Clostridium sp.]